MTTAGNGRIHLAALIQSRLDRGDSLRDIQRRAVAAGYDISHTQIDKYRQGLVQRAPELGHILALAAGLQTTEARVRRAVIRDFMGYDVNVGEEQPEDIQDCLDMVTIALGRRATVEERRPIIVAVAETLDRFEE